MNVLSREDQLSVLHLIVEGCSLRSIARLTGVHRTTTMNLLLGTGERCRAFLDKKMRGLQLDHLEIDELWTFVLKKQHRLTESDSCDVSIGDQYLFVALDLETKLIPSFVLGKRTAANAQAIMRDLAGRIVVPPLFLPGFRPQISTDGFNAYPNAVDLAFGGAANYGVLIKDYQEAEQPGRYGPPEMTGALRNVIQGDIDRKSICTSHIERQNLSIRTFLRRFTRLALGFSKKVENLYATIAIYIAYYNFCWLHGSLNGTPAMAAGIAGHPWSLAELLDNLPHE